MRTYILLLSLCCLMISCSSEVAISDNSTRFYSTQSDSCLYYYHLGWHQILNEGNYGPAEFSYRQALSFDSTFLLGQSVLARLTEDLAERQSLYEQVKAKQTSLAGDEADLLSVFMGLLEYTLLRASAPEEAAQRRSAMLQDAQLLLCGVRARHPHMDYIESECVEFINANEGAAAALDSLLQFKTEHQGENPFLLGYQAKLLADLERFPEAISVAEQVAKFSADVQLPRPAVIWAYVYHTMDQQDKAKAYIDQAVALDSKNLEATRLQAQVQRALDDGEK